MKACCGARLLTGCLACVGLILTSHAQVRPPAPVFGVGVEAVHVDVFVSSGGEPLLGLGADDFEVRDNGVVQAVELLAQEQAPTHALLLLDTSSRLSRGTLEGLKQAAHAFLDGLRDGDRVSLLTFHHRVQVRLLDGDRHAARPALDAARNEGGTALHDALYVALGLADPRRGRPVVVIFSDGDDRLSWLDADEILGVARESDAAIYAVDTSAGGPRPDLPRRAEASTAVTEDRSGFLAGQRGVDLRQGPVKMDAPASLLQRLATETGGQVFPAGTTDMQAAFLRVLGDLKSRYVLRYEPQGVARSGWHELGVKLKTRKGDLRVRRGYYVADAAGAVSP